MEQNKHPINSREEAIHCFEEKLGERLTYLVVSPGRANLIGEHTDYNQGLCAPIAINKYIYLGFVDKGYTGEDGQRKELEFRAEIISLVYGESVVLTEYPKKTEDKPWANYLNGIIDRFAQLNGGKPKGNYRVIIGGNLPIGFGISSSAALCTGFCAGLNAILGCGYGRRERLEIARWTEHNYAGTKCGHLDQTAISYSKPGHILKLDFQSNDKTLSQASTLPFEVVLLHSGEFRSLSSSAFNQRLEETATAARTIKPGENPSLRDCSLEDLEKCKDKLTPVLYNRAKYVISENHRVERLLELLNEGKGVDEIREIMRQAHNGLSKLYEVSTEKLDLLADCAYSLKDLCFGGRLMGGGFGGCTVNLVFPGKSKQFIEEVDKIFHAKYSEHIIGIPVKMSDGLRIENIARERYLEENPVERIHRPKIFTSK